MSFLRNSVNFLVNACSLLFCLSAIHPIFSQPQLSDIDTILDYKIRFFRNDTLITTNSTYYWDSIKGTYTNEIPSYHVRPRHPYLESVNHGLWVYYWDKKGRPCSKSNAAFYQLFEYNYDTHIGKSYTLNKENILLHTVEPYPIFKGEKFDGYLKLTYEKGKISAAEYRLWDDDSLKNQYLNITYFYPNGLVASHFLHDNIKKSYRIIYFTDNGFCTKDLKLDNENWYSIERKQTKKYLKEIHFLKNDRGEKTEIFIKNGIEIKSTTPKNRGFQIFRKLRWWFW